MMKQKLPRNWIVLNSKTHKNRVYYFNVKTNQSSWEVPTEDQTEQVERKPGRRSKKRKQSIDDDDVREIRPATPEHDTPQPEITERKKLIARRSIRQDREKIKEEKETPQMREIREKMLKKKEKNSPSTGRSKLPKDVQKSLTLGTDKAILVTQKSDTSTDEKVCCTPQMQVLLEKIQERASSQSKVKRMGQNRYSKEPKEEGIITTRSKKRGSSRKRDVPELVSPLPSTDEKKQINANTGVTGKEEEGESGLTKGLPTKQRRKSFKKNLGKIRMEKLRQSLALQIENQSLENSVLEILPNIPKNAEVRLVRLKERLSNDKPSPNKNASTGAAAAAAAADASRNSVTTISDLVNRSNEVSFYEEMDWEPLEDEKITFEVQAVRTQLCTENSSRMPCKLPANTLNDPLLSEHQEKRQLYIVVDTNVFLSNIEAVELAREFTFKTYDRPIIVIPWTVIRELDYIKDDNGRTKPTSLCGKARKAVSYINKLFSSKQPRIIGQTPEDVAKNKEKFSIDCPDDEILQSCLQIRDFGKSVVLLSYDVNLCNKAMIYDIVTLGRNDPLEKVDYLNATTYETDAFNNTDSGCRERSRLESSTVDQEQCFADEVFDDAKSILRDFLTVVVGGEMQALYGESWEKYVIAKPPWTAVTVLQCAVKHWIAAVSESFQRKAEFILKELLQIFRNSSVRITLKEDSYILDKCSDLVQMLRGRKHLDLMSRVSKKIDELKEKCRNYEARVNEQKLRDTIGVENNPEEQERRAQQAFQYFEAAYVFARDMCGLAAEVVGMPCSFRYNVPNPPPSVDYVKQIQPELAANVNKLLCCLSVALEQVKDSQADYRTLINLHQTLITFLPETAPTAIKLMNIDLAPLDIYCCVKRKEEVLNRGLRQLQELSTHFCRLASYRCT